MKKTIVLLAVVALSFLVGCVSDVGHFPVVSSKNMEIKRTSHWVDTSIKLKGKDQSEIIFSIPLGEVSIDDAVDRAIEKSKGAVGLANASMRHCSWNIPYIIGEEWYEIEGNPIYEKK